MILASDSANPVAQATRSALYLTAFAGRPIPVSQVDSIEGSDLYRSLARFIL